MAGHNVLAGSPVRQPTVRGCVENIDARTSQLSRQFDLFPQNLSPRLERNGSDIERAFRNSGAIGPEKTKSTRPCCPRSLSSHETALRCNGRSRASRNASRPGRQCRRELAFPYSHRSLAKPYREEAFCSSSARLSSTLATSPAYFLGFCWYSFRNRLKSSRIGRGILQSGSGFHPREPGC
jgi:hypothetical protein